MKKNAIPLDKARFPKDFMFQLNAGEKAWVVANCDHLESLKYSKSLPYAFTEHGAVMLASILNSEIAISTSIVVVRAFIELRKALASHDALRKKINELEQRYDANFSYVFKAIKQLMENPKPQRRQIGFVK
jgi:hypothetical protein